MIVKIFATITFMREKYDPARVFEKFDPPS